MEGVHGFKIDYKVLPLMPFSWALNIDKPKLVVHLSVYSAHYPTPIRQVLRKINETIKRFIQGGGPTCIVHLRPSDAFQNQELSSTPNCLACFDARPFVSQQFHTDVNVICHSCQRKEVPPAPVSSYLTNDDHLISVLLPSQVTASQLQYTTRQCASCNKVDFHYVRQNTPKFKACSRCLSVRYCSTQCQRIHYEKHRPICDSKPARFHARKHQLKEPVITVDGKRVDHNTYTPRIIHCMGCTQFQLRHDKRKTPPNPHSFPVCGRCRAAAYCSKACQRHHWPEHKKVCRTRDTST